jgi:hypothetical protein
MNVENGTNSFSSGSIVLNFRYWFFTVQGFSCLGYCTVSSMGVITVYGGGAQYSGDIGGSLYHSTGLSGAL